MTNQPASDLSARGQPSLTDPATFGEDIEFNLHTVSDLADQYCGACKGYHVLNAGKRLLPTFGGINVDRHEVAETVGKLVAEQIAASSAPLEVMIAGCADTGLFACAAHGIAMIGAPALSRCRFTVLDRCRTPLELCRYYAERHGLDIETEVVEFVDDTAPRSADLIAVHSLFRFLPRESHVDVLRKMGRWLRPGGRIVFSVKLDHDQSGEHFEGRQRIFNDDVLRRVRGGQFETGESPDALDARLSRRSVAKTTEYGDFDALQALFDQAGLPVLSTQVASGEVRPGETQYRAIAVLGPPPAA